MADQSLAMNTKPSGRFEVTSHYELSGRGAFVIGHIREGTIQIGNSVPVPGFSGCWTISGIECLDNIAERKHWNALVFKEQPRRDEVEAAFPIGAFVDVYEQAPGVDAGR